MLNAVYINLYQVIKLYPFSFSMIPIHGEPKPWGWGLSPKSKLKKHRFYREYDMKTFT
jgi:hypothetical protein